MDLTTLKIWTGSKQQTLRVESQCQHSTQDMSRLRAASLSPRGAPPETTVSPRAGGCFISRSKETGRWRPHHLTMYKLRARSLAQRWLHLSTPSLGPLMCASPPTPPPTPNKTKLFKQLLKESPRKEI